MTSNKSEWQSGARGWLRQEGDIRLTCGGSMNRLKEEPGGKKTRLPELKQDENSLRQFGYQCDCVIIL